MFKKIVLYGLLAIFIAVLVFGAVNRTQARSESGGIAENRSGRPGNTGNSQTAGSTQATQPGEGQGNSWGRSNGSGAAVANPAYGESGTLSQVEEDALLYMREEEKLAHDVYVNLYAQWGLPVFDNISGSEATHTAAVKTLLDRYSLSDPASSQVGVFTNPDLQTMYNDLIAKGNISLAEALKVGATIEEVDIQDLQERLEQTDNADIQRVFSNLLAGSQNHLRAFTSTLQTQTGETYEPQYLSPEAYTSLLTNSTGRGGGIGSGQGQGQGGRGGGARPRSPAIG